MPQASQSDDTCQEQRQCTRRGRAKRVAGRELGYRYRSLIVGRTEFHASQWTREAHANSRKIESQVFMKR